MDTLWKTRNRGMPHLGRYSDADVLTQNTTFVMRILKRLTDIHDGQRSSPNRQTGTEECMGLKLDMLTLYYRSRVRSKCQTREVDGTMGFLTEHAWILVRSLRGYVSRILRRPSWSSNISS